METSETPAPVENPAPIETADTSDAQRSSAATGELGWTSRDGSVAHDGIQRELYMGDFEYAETEYGVRVADGNGGYTDGRIDAYLDDRHVVDIKTHDASGWSPGEATCYGDAHGRQVAGYVSSPDVEPGCQGHLAMCGREPSAEAKTAYEEAAARHDVSTLWVEDYDTFGGAADQITTHVRARETG